MTPTRARSTRTSAPPPARAVRRNVAVGLGAKAPPAVARLPFASPAYAFAPPSGAAGVQAVYGRFEHQEAAKGWITVTDGWAHDNLVLLRKVCGTGLSIQLHRLVAPLFEACLADAMGRCPAYAVRMLGGYAARHKMNDPSRGLSIHAWGAAFDVNWDRNGVGRSAPHDLPEAFVRAFTDRGWDWGGAWRSSKDWMHFQFATGV